MPDWLSNADVWVKILTVVTGALSFMTALITFRKTRAAGAEPQQATTAPRLRMLALESYSKPWSPYWLKSLIIIGGVMTLPMLILGFVVFVSEPSAGTAFPLLFFAVCAAGYVFSARRLWGTPQQGSIAKREATINVQGSYDQIWDRCIATLKRIKAAIKTMDATKGLIEANIGLTWRSWGEIVVVQVSRIGADECSVHVKSDSKLVTTAFDYGKSASNIRRFVDELVH
jgi:hypothetical protein